MLLYRGVLGARDRVALAFYSATELSLVVAITTIATETGHMKTSTAAGLVGAAMLSTLVFPFVGLALRKEAEREEHEPGNEPPLPKFGAHKCLKPVPNCSIVRSTLTCNSCQAPS